MSLLSPPHPGFFEILATPRAYTTLLYLLLSMATGILAFTYAVAGRFQVWLARHLLVCA